MVGRKSRSRTRSIRRGSRGGFLASERRAQCRRAGVTHTCARRKAPASRQDSLSPLLSHPRRSGRGARTLAYESRWRAICLNGHHDAQPSVRADAPVRAFYFGTMVAARRSTCTLGGISRLLMRDAITVLAAIVGFVGILSLVLWPLRAIL
jgi:hypothetical protein